MRKQAFSILVALILLVSMVQFAEAHFPQVHAYVTLKSIRESDSEITRRCSEELLMAGNGGSDSPVVHYLEGGQQLSSYVGTHTYAAHVNGFRLASTDDERCLVHGNPLHIIQDTDSHLEIVPQMVGKFWSTNLILHGVVEKSFENAMVRYLKAHPDPTVSIEEIKHFTANSLNPFFENERYVTLLNGMTGIDIRTDLGIVDTALKAGSGDSTVWNKTVYGKQVMLPWYFYGMCIAGMLVGIFFIVLSFLNGWSKLDLIIGLIILIIAALVLASILTGRSWLWYNGLVSIPDTLGIIRFDDATMQKEINTMLTRSKYYLENEKLVYDDATGLTYCKKYSSSGSCSEWTEGPLNKAEWKYNFVILPLIIISLGLFIFWRVRKAIRGGD